MNDERREHGAVDESSLEQQICESNDHTLIVRKNQSSSTSATDYRTRQIIRGGKLSRLDAESTIRWKTFAVKQVGILLPGFFLGFRYLNYAMWSSPPLWKSIVGKLSRLPSQPRKPRKFSPLNDLPCTVLHQSGWHAIRRKSCIQFQKFSKFSNSTLDASLGLLNQFLALVRLCVPIH